METGATGIGATGPGATGGSTDQRCQQSSIRTEKVSGSNFSYPQGVLCVSRCSAECYTHNPMPLSGASPGPHDSAISKLRETPKSFTKNPEKEKTFGRRLRSDSTGRWKPVAAVRIPTRMVTWTSVISPFSSGDSRSASSGYPNTRCSRDCEGAVSRFKARKPLACARGSD